MNPFFVRVFGWPHELLHVLALLLIGRRPKGLTSTHVDIPSDLSTGEYIFVAGLPALVFWGAASTAALSLFEARDVGQLILRFLLTLAFSIAALGTLGDLHLIITRFLDDDSRSHNDEN